VRIATWNINSLRLRIDTLRRVVETIRPDVVCLQETKVRDEEFPLMDVRALGFNHVLYHGMPNYNGVAILSKAPLKQLVTVDWCERDDCRYLSARLPGGAVLHNFYVPAGGDVPDPEQNDMFAHKLRFLDEMIHWFDGQKPGRAILVGDLNIAPLETDVWSHKQLLKVVSHTPVEVERLGRVMAAHRWVDAVRHIVPPSQQLYSWWSYRNRTWPGDDRGRRLDHVWVTPALAGRVKDAAVLREARGWDRPSDHAPVWADIDLM